MCEKREQGMNPHIAVAHKVAHLYVMQATDGRIKIGRSQNPDRRLLALQSAAGIKLHLIAVFEGRGDEELAVHAALKEHRGVGEWFSASKASREAVRALLGPSVKFRFGDMVAMREKGLITRLRRADERAQEQLDQALAAGLERIKQDALRHPWRKIRERAARSLGLLPPAES